MIRLRGVRHNNLKNFDLDLPLNRLIVITGLSGSGKSSLAYDTLFAEGQRRYIETFSPYARQFFDRMDKPQVDTIEGIPPAIAIEQRNAVKTTRSTVGTMTEICDYMKLLWPHLAQLHCQQCGQPVRKETPQVVWETLNTNVVSCWSRAAGGNKQDAGPTEQEVLIAFTLPLTEKLSLGESLALVAKQGYQRLVMGDQIARIDELLSEEIKRPSQPTSLTVIQDRVKLAHLNRARFIEACEQAYHFGKGKLVIWEIHPPGRVLYPRPFSNRLHCAQCDIEYREATPALFSFNHPLGACPACRGFGRVISIDYNLALPDRAKTLAEGVVKPWQTGQGAECQADLLRVCRHFEIPTNVPFQELPKKWQDFVVEGDPNYGKDEEHEWPRAWYGIKGYFRWLESRAYKMHVRVLLSRYRAYTTCPKCQGTRFQSEALLYKVDPASRLSSNQAGEARTGRTPARLTLPDFYQLPIRDALEFIKSLVERRTLRPNDPLGLILKEVQSRLGYLNEVGLGYLTLDRPTRSLSGGETERVNLTTCLGTCLVNTLFVLDEPSVGLHPRDTERLVHILQQLRDAGNTVVVVEHEASVMRAADQIVDLGPGHGATGGQVVFQGSYAKLLKCSRSLTGQYLSGTKLIPLPRRRPVRQASRLSYVPEFPPRETQDLVLRDLPGPMGERPDVHGLITRGWQNACPTLRLSQATCHNLKNLAVEIPLGRFVCITGVSGSGKTTLVREVLLPALAAKLKTELPGAKASERLGAEHNGDMEDDKSEPCSPNQPRLEGVQHVSRAVLVDQSILAKTPRSNPAVYIGAFDELRELFAQSELSQQRGLNASAFSFNSSQGQCERCRGAGFEKIEMQFLSDVYIRCPDCDGRRYRPHILEIQISPKSKVQSPKSKLPGRVSRFAFPVSRARQQLTLNAPHASMSIADLLDATVEEAINFLSGFPDSRPAQQVVASLNLLQEVGLGYLKLGQPINTLSGGESQRLKLVRHLAEVDGGNTGYQPLSSDDLDGGAEAPILFLFDEPTTGLHFDDVRVLLNVFQRLVNAGHSLLVIEHNLDVIKSADWVIDLGPEAGDQGGQIVAEGTPEQIAACAQSHTGRALRELLEPALLAT